MWHDAPSTIVVAIGINDVANPKTNQTNAQVATNIEQILAKIVGYGVTPIWLGVESSGGNPVDNTNVDAVNALVEAYCEANGIIHGSTLDTMELYPTWQTDYYTDLAASVHPNVAGYLFMGQLGEHLYSVRKIMGTDEIDIGAGARLYSDGKFKDLGTATAVTADLSVTPLSGSFDEHDALTAYMDITIDSWLTSGTYNKQWTASSSVATTTIYTVGDLAPNTYYQFKLDGVASPSSVVESSQCTGGTCLADTNGHITFTYQGGYTSHTFALVDDLTAPVAATLSSPLNGGSTVTVDQSFSWGAASDAESGLSKYQLYIDDALNTDNISISATSVVPSGLACDGGNWHSWYIRAYDKNGNYTNSNTFSYATCGDQGSFPVHRPSTTTHETVSDTVEAESVAEDLSTEDVSADLDGSVGTETNVMSFSDLDSSHWAYAYIIGLANEGILNGYSDGTFKPDQPIDRAEFLKVALETYEDLIIYDLGVEIAARTNPFTDVDPGDWFYEYVTFASYYDMVDGYQDGTFKPDQSVTRAEAVKMVLLSTGIPLLIKTPDSIFSDVPENSWYKHYIMTLALDTSILAGYSDGTFRPDQSITRAEAVKVIEAVLEMIS
jgi:hypothetical protein